MKTSLLMAVVLSLILASGCSWMPFFGKDKDSGEEEFDPDATEQYVLAFLFAGTLCFLAAACSVVIWALPRRPVAPEEL